MPAIIAMSITSLYNIIAGIFIGQGVGVLGISGLAVSFPLMNLMIAVCFLVGVGGATLCSIYLGKHDVESAQKVLAHTLMLSVLTTLLLSSVCLVFLDEILVFFGSSQASLPYAHDYMIVLTWGMPISFVMLGLNSIMRASGHPQKAMYTAMVSVAVNVVLTPFFIFGLGWGMFGAGLATILAQSVSMIIIVQHFMNQKNFLHFSRKYMVLEKKLVMNIFSKGTPPFFMNVCACLIVVMINGGLQQYGGDIAVGAYGIVNRILMLVAMVVIGLTQGMQPIIGYNFGAKQYDRVLKVLNYGMLIGACISTAGFLCAQIFPAGLSALFTDNAELISISATALRISTLVYPLVGSQIVISSFFQAVGKPKIATLLSLTRQLLFLLPCLIFLPQYMGLTGIWWSMPIADALACVITTLCLIPTYKELRRGVVRDTVN